MSSVIDYKKCPRCGGVMYYEYNCRTGEEFSVCQRCGASYGMNEKTSYGRCLIWFKRGAGQSFSLAEPVNNKIKKWYRKQLKRDDVDPDRSYLMAWDPDEEEVKLIYGTDPGLYEDEF